MPVIILISIKIGSANQSILYRTLENNEPEIFSIQINSLMKSYLAVEDTEYGEFDMIHTENFMLIDKKRQIRGFYDGTDDLEIDRLLSDIEILKKID